MRMMLAAAALLGLSACGEASLEGAPPGETSGYTMEILARDEEQIYVVTAPDGRTTAAHVFNGQSTIMDTDDVQAFAAEHAAEMPAPDEGGDNVVVRMPGFALQVEDNQDGGTDRARVAIDIAGFAMNVDAGDGADGERATVRFTGVDANSAREFITEADDIAPGVQQEMLDALGL